MGAAAEADGEIAGNSLQYRHQRRIRKRASIAIGKTRPMAGFFAAERPAAPGGRVSQPVNQARENSIDMKIWVDADACPIVAKEILFRAAARTGVQLTLVANQAVRVPRSPNIDMLKVKAGFDVADNEIVKRLESGDLVVTSDIPLAAEVIAKGGHALSPRGELYSADTIRERLNMRDFMDTLRASGINTGGPAALSHGDRQAFANHLDRLLATQQS